MTGVCTHTHQYYSYCPLMYQIPPIWSSGRWTGAPTLPAREKQRGSPSWWSSVSGFPPDIVREARWAAAGTVRTAEYNWVRSLSPSQQRVNPHTTAAHGPQLPSASYTPTFVWVASAFSSSLVFSKRLVSKCLIAAIQRIQIELHILPTVCEKRWNFFDITRNFQVFLFVRV